MTPELRSPSESQREQLLELLRISLNVSAERQRHRGPKLPLEQFLCAFEAGARVGAMTPDDPAVPFLAKLFAGPAPWAMDFF